MVVLIVESKQEIYTGDIKMLYTNYCNVWVQQTKRLLKEINEKHDDRNSVEALVYVETLEAYLKGVQVGLSMRDNLDKE